MTPNGQDRHVVFGSGAVGMAVAETLAAQGKSVWLVNRSGQAQAPAGVEIKQGEATDAAITRQLCQGAAVVYNCTNAPYDKWPELFPPLQAGILAGAAAAGAKLVVMDNLYMYGPTGGHPLTESLPNAATTRKGRVRATMAQDLLAAHQAGQVRVAIGRASDFFGPRALQSAMGERIFYPALAGKPAQLLGNPNLPHTFSYIPDIARGLVTLGDRDEALGQVWHLPGPETVTTRRFIDMIFEETGHSSKIQTLPKLVLKGLALFNPMMRELAEMLYEFEEPFILDSGKFEQAFGRSVTPLAEAIRHTVAWYRQHPQ